MSAVDPQPLPDAPPMARPPRVWKFWGTCLWGLVVFAALFLGQLSVIGYLYVVHGTADLHAALTTGRTLAASVIAGLPAVLLALWVAISFTRLRFADYLALRWAGWRELVIGIAGLLVVVGIWEILARVTGRESSSGFVTDVVKSARSEGVLPLLAVAICVVAPATEELFVRGFLFRGWSESFLRPAGAIVLSSLVWSAMHLQYDLFFLGEVFSIGLWLGYLRWRSNSTWVTIVVHGLNNFAALAQSLVLIGQPPGQ